MLLCHVFCCSLSGMGIEKQIQRSNITHIKESILFIVMPNISLIISFHFILHVLLVKEIILASAKVITNK